jgi:hypothetical protein
VIPGDEETVYVHPTIAVHATLTFGPDNVAITGEGPLKTREFSVVTVGPTNDVPITVGVSENV